MLLHLDDFEAAARKRLPRPLFGYISGASETSSALEDNRAVFREIRLVPRVLRGVEGRSIARHLFRREWSAPFGIAPMGIAALMARNADIETARAAAKAGVPYVLSGSSLTPMERVIEANPET
jgi:L-lactate dehydrogenase (cytochrome)